MAQSQSYYNDILLKIEMNQKQIKRGLYATTISSSLAGMLARFLVHPIDTIKAKIQVQRTIMKNVTDFRSGKVIQLVKQTFQNQGVKGFYRGGTITIFGSSIAFSLYMSFYEHSKLYFSSLKVIDHPTIVHLISGVFAELGSCILWLPIDIVKERLQVQSELKIYSYKSPLDAIKKINLSQGMIGLYRALGATLLFFGPFSAIFFAVYQFLKEKILKQSKKPTLVQSIFCSATAGSIAGFITTPLQLVKLRMQIQRAHVGLKGGTLQNSVFGYKNSFHGLYLIATKQGLAALYRGALLRVCFSVPMTTLSMTLTEFFKQRLVQKDSILDYMI